ncbi:MAG: hypothetical protein JO128_15010 [Alphaproteobacteria bacterium]|nr:hypothetical protein [Alphaproteobacteria bacterium]
MANDQKVARDLARQHLEAIEAALAQVNTRLTSTKQKFERAFKTADPADPTRLGFDLEQAAFEMERRKLNVMRDAAKAHYLKTFKSPETGGR